MIKRLLFAAIASSLWSTSMFAQSGPGQLSAWGVVGNPTSSAAPPSAATLSQIAIGAWGTPVAGYAPIATSPSAIAWGYTPLVQGSGGFGTINPYTFVWPSGTVYPNYNPLATTQIYLPNGALQVNNTSPYGNLGTAQAGGFVINSNRGGCANGYTADSQIAAGSLQEVGAISLCAQADTVPSLFSAAGTFTATTFVPTTNMTAVNVTYPFGTTTTVTQQSLLRVNMWVVTNDTIPFYGRITSIGTGAGITVSGWFQLGNSTAGQVPSGTAIYANPQNFFWSFQSNLFINSLGKSVASTFTRPTGTVTNTSATITGVSDTTGAMVGQLISAATCIPAGSAIVSFTINSITINQAATCTPGGNPVSLTISTHPGNTGIHWEPDIFNSGPAFSPLTPVKATGCTAVAGNNTLTGCSAIPATIRWGHIVYPSDATKVAPAAWVIGVPSGTSVTLNQAALANGSVDITFFSAPTEGGLGIHGACVLAASCNTMFEASGSWTYGMLVHGAADTAFLMRSDGLGPTPNFGFRYDHSITGVASNNCDFGVTGSGVTLWCITSGGTEFIQNIFSGGGIGFGVKSAWVGVSPTIASGFCTGAAISGNNGTASFDINVGTPCAGSVGALTMPAAATGWTCKFTDITTPASYVIDQTGPGTTTNVPLTAYARTTGIASNFTANDHIRGSCSAY